MNILLAHPTTIPPLPYGGAERIIWWLGKELARRGHHITYLVKKGSVAPFAKVLIFDEKRPLAEQIPEDCDIAHLHSITEEQFACPVIYTFHRNAQEKTVFHPNTVFLSADHARRHGAKVYVHNGLDFDDYGTPVIEMKRAYFHFLGRAEWRFKNVRGAIDLAGAADSRLHVIGGSRVNFRQGLRITLTPHVRFHGMLAGDGKNMILNGSKGLIFPALWHEPFGLAIIESLYFGCPVFGTPYGALPELLKGPDKVRSAANGAHWNGQVDAVFSEYGFLSVKKAEIVEALKNADSYDRQLCHEYARGYFSVARMADDYLRLYETVLSGKPLHDEPPAMKEAPDGKLLPMR